VTAEPEQAAPESMSLARLRKACALLDQVRQIEDVLDLRDKAAAVAHYMGHRNHGARAHADAWEIMQRATRRLGELCAELPQNPTGGRPKKTGAEPAPVSKRGELQRLGIQRRQADRWERFAAVPADDFAERLRRGRERLEQGKSAKPVDGTASAAEHDSDAWGTPEEYAQAARELLGGIELDPASNAAANNVIRAERFYTKVDSGFDHEWRARSVWLNPPFSKPLCGQLTARFIAEYDAEHFAAGLVLVNNATDTGWFQSLLARFAVCLPSKRIAFLVNGRPIDQNRQGQAVFCAGVPDADFARVFGKFGRIDVPFGG
jgi:hypothetical protein